MYRNITKNAGMLPLLCIAAFAFFNVAGLNAQNYLKNMGNGLKATVNCSCTDSVGNIYAVTSKSPDTADINKWDITTKSWSMYARLPKFYTDKSATCEILYGKFYLTGYISSPYNVDIMEYAGSWKKKASFNIQIFSGYGVTSAKLKNKLFFAGAFDSMGGVYTPNVAVFNGSVISASGFPITNTHTAWLNTDFEIVADTLYMTFMGELFRYTQSGTWTSYYKSTKSSWFEGVTYHNGMLYLNTYWHLEILKNGSKIDSIDVPNVYQVNLKSCKNKLFIAEISGISSSVYVIQNTKDVKFMFNNSAYDSSKYSLISNNTNFYYECNGLTVNNTNYNNIVEVIVDSIKPVGFDTIRGYVFWDKNNNYVKDGTDVWPLNGNMHNVTSNTYPTLGYNNGTFEEIVLENSTVEYNIYNTTFDSCVFFNFSGNVRGKNTDPGITIDTLYFPLVKSTKSIKNLILKNISLWRARLNDTIPIAINIRNKDCNFANTGNSTVTITLDPNTRFVSSSPAYTSKNGNVYTFSNLTINYNTDNLIKLNVVYPNTSYSIGNTVRHFARLSNVNGEDTMDNMDSIVQKMVYSYDPNSKHSVPEGRVTKDLKNIRYYIDFQNLGNDDAVRVTVIDTLNLKIPVYEFQMVACSHPYSVSITPGTNIVTWVFDKINLKPKTKDDAASKGYIIFDAKLRTNVKIGDSIRNRAYIYFDYNTPVITNFAVINRVDAKERLVRLDRLVTKSLIAYPNPAQNYIQIENIAFNKQNIVIYDLRGAVVTSFQLNVKEKITLPVENWAKGMYLLKNDLGEHCQLIVD